MFLSLRGARLHCNRRIAKLEPLGVPDSPDRTALKTPQPTEIIHFKWNFRDFLPLELGSDQALT